VPPGDVDALAAALDRVTADRGLRARLAAGARARSADYAWPALSARVAAVYERLLGVRRDLEPAA
jgi:2-deoxystreptamine N-acetyl-D-glucosaminyltransferase/2-deoxystreptamine glucosyltransferase